MDKNGNVQVIPISSDYRKGYDSISWDSPSITSKVAIYDPFLDGPIEELVPGPVTMTVTGGGFPAEALTITFPVDGSTATYSDDTCFTYTDVKVAK